MRKIVAGEFISLDGVVEAPEAWQFPYFNEQVQEAVQAGMSAADTLLLGRVTYQIFAAAWPQQGTDEPIAAWLNDTPKVVVSTTLATAEWQRTTLVTGNLVEELTRLKQQPGKTSRSPAAPRWSGGCCGTAC